MKTILNKTERVLGRFLSPNAYRLMPRGFTLLFASLVSSLLLAVGVAIFDITLKEALLSSTVRDSAYAVYTADAAIECALYWDFKYGGTGSAFATSSTSASPSSGVMCNNQDIAADWTVEAQANAATTTFTMTMSPQNYCALVTVSKRGNPLNTVIVSHGFNTCNASDPRRIERALQVSY